jgi:hypothetical protein
MTTKPSHFARLSEDYPDACAALLVLLGFFRAHWNKNCGLQCQKLLVVQCREFVGEFFIQLWGEVRVMIQFWEEVRVKHGR